MITNNPQKNNVPTGFLRGSMHCIEFGAAFWATSLASTIIHEGGHLLAARMCKVPVYQFYVGMESGRPRAVWRKTFRFKGSQPIEAAINFLNPFQGHVIHGKCQSVWHEVFITFSGPLAQASVMAVPYCLTNRRIEANKVKKEMPDPLILGIYLASAFGILVAFGNLLPIFKGSDGSQLKQELKDIAGRSTLS